MLPISPKLMERLEKKLGVRRRRLYELILDVATSRLVERDTAALILAAEQKIPIQLYSTPEQRAMMRSGQVSQAAQTSNIGPSSQPPSRSGKTTQKRPAKRTDENSVFVVHGRDEALKRSIYAFLRSVGLKPLEWEHALLQAKDVNPHIDDVLDVLMARVQAVVVLFSPDDDTMLNSKLWARKEPASEKKPSGQPRANVLFEAGMALARHPSKTLIVQIGKVRGFSDIAGQHVIRLTNSKEKRNDVLNRLEKIGCKVDRHGVAWMTEGDFTAARDKR